MKKFSLILILSFGVFTPIFAQSSENKIFPEDRGSSSDWWPLQEAFDYKKITNQETKQINFTELLKQVTNLVKKEYPDGKLILWYIQTNEGNNAFELSSIKRLQYAFLVTSELETPTQKVLNINFEFFKNKSFFKKGDFTGEFRFRDTNEQLYNGILNTTVFNPYTLVNQLANATISKPVNFVGAGNLFFLDGSSNSMFKTKNPIALFGKSFYIDLVTKKIYYLDDDDDQWSIISNYGLYYSIIDIYSDIYTIKFNSKTQKITLIENGEYGLIRKAGQLFPYNRVTGKLIY